MKEFKVNDKVIISKNGHKVSKIIEVTKSGNYKVENGTIFNKNGYLRGEKVSKWDNSTTIQEWTKEKEKDWIIMPRIRNFLGRINWNEIEKKTGGDELMVEVANKVKVFLDKQRNEDK